MRFAVDLCPSGGQPARGGHSHPKDVFSTSLEKAEWNNTTPVTGDVADAISDLKRQDGKDLAIFGSSP